MEGKNWKRKEQALLEAEKAAACILQAGCMLMSNGAEVYRVEETMTRMGYSIPGVNYCTAYVTVTGVMCSVEIEGQTITRIARLKDLDRNMTLVSAVNDLSRQAEKKHYSAEALSQKLLALNQLPNYSDSVKTLWGAIGAAGFAIFFGGGLIEIGLVFLIGLFIRLSSIICGRLRINDFFINVLLSFITAVLAKVFHYLIPQAQTSILIISSIMLLVPGLTITNALRDSVMGEPLSSLVLMTQAMLVACAIAIGVLMGLSLMRM